MKLKKFTAILLSVVLLITMFPIGMVGAAASDNSQQIVSLGGESVTPDERIKISKTVSATEDENYFDITLTVNQELPATDIVLVMDISNTMNQNHNGVQTNVVADKRLTKAKNAAKAFIEEYSKTTGICKNRRVGMVQFNTNASQVFALGNVNDNLETYKTAIDAIVAPPGEERFTNIEAGLQLAANMLESSTAEQKYIILITDGFPTTYIESGRTSTEKIKGWDVSRTINNPPSSKPTTPEDGLFWDFVKNMACSGTSYSDTAAVKARNVATEIKNDGINIYTIGVDISNESQTIQKYIDQGDKGGYTIVERTGNSYEVGSATDSTAYKNWLGKKIGGGPDLAKANVTNAFAQGDTVDQLETAFTTVLNYILGSEPDSVTDPMGDNIEFLGFYDKNGNLTESLSGSHVSNGENTAVYGNEIAWNITGSGYTEVTTTGATYRTYTLRYRIRLTNEADGFVSEKSYSTNGRTLLNYSSSDNTAKTLDFIVPSVEGYLGTLEIVKTDSESGNKLEGAVFTLAHNANCSVCGGEVDIDEFVAETNSQGSILLDSIPSGHEYTLSETQAPEGYVESNNTYAVTVAYGKTYVDSSETSTVVVSNEALSPVSITLSGKKTLSGGDKTDSSIADGQFSFTVENNNNKGVSGVPSEVDVKAGGTIDFGEWTITLPGTYTFEIEEKNLGNAGYGYDGASYTVQVTVSVDGKILVAETEILKNGVAADEIIFSNTYTAPESVANAPLGGKVNLAENGNDKQIKDGQFSLTVTADPENDPDGYEASLPSDASADSDGEFEIDEIKFKKPGTYSFVVKQDNKDAAGYTYDLEEVVITYTVTLDESTNTLVVSDPEITKSGEPADEIIFNNTYETPTPAELPVDGITTLTGGGKTSDDITEGLFSYVIEGGDQENVLDVPSSIETADDGALDFGTWKFSEEGEYTFTVNENTPPAGYTDETGEVTVTVTVTLNEETNKLEATAVYSSGEQIKIDNTYVAPDPIKATIDGAKILTENGEEIAIEENRFSASIKAGENNDGTGYIFEEESVSIGTDGKFEFSDIVFLKDGVYVFTVTEDDKGAAGYHYDSGVYTVEFVVSLETSDNTLNISETVITRNGEPVDEIVFRNTYDTPAPAELPVDGITTLTGGGKTSDDITEGLFSYVIEGGDQENVLDVPSSIETADDGALDFGTWKFSEEGEYTFTVNENTPPAGYTDETGEVTVTVTVILNEETNELEATAVYSSGEQIKIDNTYVAPDPIDVDLDGKVTLSGQKTNDDIAEGDFTFKVWADENNNADGFTGFNETESSAQGGALDFGSAAFSKEGVYQFAITQDNHGKTGYVYDEETCYVKVTVTLDKETNTLVSETEIIKNGEVIDEVLFENEYYPVPLTVEVVFNKEVIGWPYEDAQFEFSMNASNSANPMPEGSENGSITVTVTGEGEIRFGEMTFTEPGVYTYTVSEIKGDDFGYIYDKKVYEITYTVTDVDGVLEATRTVTLDGEVIEETEFTNVYVPIIPIIPIVPPVFPPIIGLPDELPDIDLPEIDIPEFDLPDFGGNGSDNGSDGNGGSGDIDDEIPNTGSEDAIAWHAILCIAICTAYILYFRRKRTA